MLAVILSTVRNTGPSLRVNETEMFMIRGTGSRPFHTYYSEHALPMKFIPGSLSVVTKGNYLLLFGAEAEYMREVAVRFDVKTNTWLDLKPPPHKASMGIATTLSKDNIYLLGGRYVTKDSIKYGNAFNNFNGDSISKSVSQYSIETNSWSKLENLPKPLAFHAAASHGNYVFCAGGASLDCNSTDKLYAFDFVGKIWLTKAPMNCRRVCFSMEAVQGKLVACGGEGVASVEIYDMADDQWTLIQDETLENPCNCASVVLNDRVYIIGGLTTNADGTRSNTDCVSCVDVDNATVREVSTLPWEPIGHVCALLTVPNTLTANMSGVNNSN